MAEADGGTVVLHVEDEPGMRRLVALSLRGEPFVLVDTETVADAIEKFREHRPRVVIIDLALGEDSGIDLARALRAEAGAATTTLIALTALADRTARDAASEAGFDLYLTKPFSPTALRSSIRAVLGLREGG